MAECIFCAISSGKINSDILYRDPETYVIRDIRPRAPVHLLVVPHKHIPSVEALEPHEKALVGHLFTVAHQMAGQEGFARSGYRLVVNNGPDSGQEVAHLHLHVLAGRRLGPMA